MVAEMNHKELTALIKRISGQANFIGAPRIYIDIFDGDLVAAVWLNQVVYWDGKNEEPIGFYKTYADWRKELGLSEYQVRRVAKTCQEMGLVNIMFRKVYGTPKNHYLVVWPELLKIIQETLKKPDPEETKGSETKGSETKGSEGEVSSGSKEGEESQGSLTEIEISPKTTNFEFLKTLGLDWIIAAGQEVTQDMINKAVREKKAKNEFERVFGFGSLPWSSNAVWTKFEKFIVRIFSTDPNIFSDYVAWREGDGKYKAFSNKKIRENPQMFMDTGYPEFEASKMYIPQPTPAGQARSHKL